MPQKMLSSSRHNNEQNLNYDNAGNAKLDIQSKYVIN